MVYVGYAQMGMGWKLFAIAVPCISVNYVNNLERIIMLLLL